MIPEGPSNRTSQGSVTHGVCCLLPLGRSVSFETTPVPLPTALKPHLSSRRALREGRPHRCQWKEGQSGGRCRVPGTQKCSSHSRHQSQLGKKTVCWLPSLAWPAFLRDYNCLLNASAALKSGHIRFLHLDLKGSMMRRAQEQ